MVEYLLFGGESGAGRSTRAAASGLELGRAGRETLVVSTDPAHSLADAFEREIGDERTFVGSGVSSIEVDQAGEAPTG